MAFVKKTWKDRLSQYPTIRVLTDTTSGDTQTVDVARAEGTVTEEGDAFSADNMNDLESRIEAAIEGGGGATYSAGDWIRIDENNVISVVTDNKHTNNRVSYTLVGTFDNSYPGGLYITLTKTTTVGTSVTSKTYIIQYGPEDIHGIIKRELVEWEDDYIRVHGTLSIYGAHDWGVYYKQTNVGRTHNAGDDWTVKGGVTLPDQYHPDNLTFIYTVSSEKLVTQDKLDAQVLPNPTPSGTPTNLETIEIGGQVYAIPQGVPVEANPSGQASSNLQKLKVGNSIYGIEQVSANVAVSTLAAPLTTLKIGDDEYTVPSGGGTTVVANPSGTATDDLEKIQIGSTIYDIPGSGSGGEQYTCDLLFENNPLPSPTSGTGGVTRTYTLNHSIDDYDAVYVASVLSYSQGYEQQDGVLIFKRDYYFTATYSGEEKYSFCIINLSVPAAIRRLFGRFTDDTTLQTYTDDKESSAEPMLYKVYGLKFAASVINNPVYMSDFYDTEERIVGRWTDGRPLYQKSVVQDLTLSDSWQNYANVAGMNVVDVEINKLIRDDDQIAPPFQKEGICSWVVRDNYLKMAVQGSLAFEGWVLKSATIKYTKTADTPGTGPTAGNIIYLPALYSEEEREVGVWKDGKPLYQKSFDMGSNITIAGDSWGNSNISGAAIDIDRLVDVILASDSNYNYYGHIGGSIDSDSAKTIQFLNPRSTATAFRYVTLQYTKASDTAGSGTWTPDGQLSHHYMTSEHIVGTWIDGSTLYERSWDWGSDLSLSANNWTNTTISNAGMSLITGVECVTSFGAFRGNIEASVNSGGDYVQLRSDGIASSVRYVTLQYTKA